VPGRTTHDVIWSASAEDGVTAGAAEDGGRSTVSDEEQVAGVADNIVWGVAEGGDSFLTGWSNDDIVAQGGDKILPGA
jgi:hypothetical protein